MHKDEKFFDTGFRILEVLRQLLNNNLSKTELMKIIDESLSKSNIYSFEAFIKYFNTLNLLGLDVEKVEGVYLLKSALYGINLTKAEKDLFFEIIQNVSVLNNDSSERAVKNLACKFAKYILAEDITQEKICKVFEESEEKKSLSVNNTVISYLKELIKDNMQLKVEYFSKNKVKKSLIVELKEIREKNNRVYIKCYIPKMARNKNICIEDVISLEKTPNKSANNTVKNAVIFKVYGRLASLYKVKPSEKVLSFDKDCLTISNTDEDRDILLKRLLKYGENCAIVSPTEVKDEFLLMVNEIIAKLEA